MNSNSLKTVQDALRKALRSRITWDARGTVSDHIAAVLARELGRLGDQAIVNNVVSLVARHDYRLAAGYVRSVRAEHSDITDLYEQLLAAPGEDHGRIHYSIEVSNFRASGASTRGGGRDLKIADSYHMLVHPTGGPCLAVLEDEAMADLLNLTNTDAGGELGDFIEQQLDVASPNARVRQGVVKAWFLPDGRRVASKRENPSKPGRLQREYAAYKEICRRLTRTSGGLAPLTDHSGTGRSWVGVAPVLAVVQDGTTPRRYTVSSWQRGTTVEELLLQPGRPGQRRALLTAYRAILDLLFDHGIFWGDMSPRNIIVDQTEDGVVYRIVDFEKTRFIDRSISKAERIVHCRGQIGVEELSILCEPAEVVNCLHGYFDPEQWDTGSNAPLPFEPRPEIAAVLAGRGIGEPTLGQYNRVDRDFLGVRSPYVDPRTRQRRYPGQLGFKTEHYLSCSLHSAADDYDRMVTEILISARRHGILPLVHDTLASATQNLESVFVAAEFILLLAGDAGSPVTVPSSEVANLTRTIKSLYRNRNDPAALPEACSAYLDGGEPA